MIPTFFDLRTGKTAKSPFDNNEYWWTEGNGSCDCNRHQGFPGIGELMEQAKHDELPDLLSHKSVCFGCHRFIAIDVEGDLEGETKERLLMLINTSYLP